MQTSKERLLAADSVHASSLKTLGLQTSRGLTSASLRDAFRACALAWHPDRHAGPEKHAAEAKFKEAQTAYTLLKSLLDDESSGAAFGKCSIMLHCKRWRGSTRVPHA